MNAPKFTKEEWKAALGDKGTPIELNEAQKAIVEVLEDSANVITESIELSLKLADAGVKIDYSFSPDKRTLEEMVNSELCEFDVEDALDSIVVQ